MATKEKPKFFRVIIKIKLGKEEDLLTTVKRRKLARLGQVTRHQTLVKTTLQGTVQEWREEGAETEEDKDSNGWITSGIGAGGRTRSALEIQRTTMLGNAL